MSTELKVPEKVELKTELALQIRGEIVSSNLPAYASEIRAFIAALPTELKTDDDFDGAKQNVKALTTVEAAVKRAKEETLKQAKEVYEVLSELDSISDVGRETRLELSKLIKAEDARVKKEIKDEALSLIDGHTFKQEQRIDAAMKGKRLLKTLRESAMNEAQAIVTEITEKKTIISEFLAEHGEKLGYDERLLMEMDAPALRTELDRRLERQRHEEEQARLKAEADAAKAEVEKAKVIEEEVAKDRNTQHGKTILVDTEETLGSPSVGKSQPPSHPMTAREVNEFSPAQEMQDFLNTVPPIFGMFREARLKLKDPTNFAKAEAFAQAVNDAWHNFKNSL